MLVDVLEAPEGFGNDLIEKVDKKTNTPMIPSMIVLPAPHGDNARVEGLSKLTHHVRVVQVMINSLMSLNY